LHHRMLIVNLNGETKILSGRKRGK